MKANVLYGINDLKYIDVQVPEIPHGWVLLNVKAAGICGSDIARVFKTGTYKFPTIIGHEFAGEVVKVNSGDEYLLNQRCAVFPLIPCMECDSCRQGHYETCIRYNYLGSRCDGGFAEYVAVPKWNLLPLHDNISMKSAAMFEPAAVGLHALRRIKFRIGESIAIFGPGTIGCILVRLAQICGAKQVVVIGRSQSKLDFITETFGVATINSTKVDVNETIMRLTCGEGVDVSVEGTGAGASLNTCIDITKSFGRVLTLGNPIDDIKLNKNIYWKILRKELMLVGTWNSAFGTNACDWETIKDFVSVGTLSLEKLVTHTFPLCDLRKGLDIVRDKNVYSNKVMIVNE